jgi:hypothetical protein
MACIKNTKEKRIDMATINSLLQHLISKPVCYYQTGIHFVQNIAIAIAIAIYWMLPGPHIIATETSTATRVGIWEH